LAGSYRFPDLPVPVKQGLYDPQFERSACGVGLVANIDGTQSHEIIRQGLEVLINLGHRGAAGADPETGDGAGLMLQMPHEFFVAEATRLGFVLPGQGDYGVATVFLPMEAGVRATCETAIEGIVSSEGLRFLGWRDVPTDPSAIGDLAARMQPFVRQFFVALDTPLPPDYTFELKLFVLRRQIETAVPAMGLENADEFYVCSLSSNRVVYKGLLKAEQLENFYHDLAEPSLKSAFAMVHSRFGTNTLGTWRLAHPYRFVIHNGEINTLRGNMNWMMAREPMLSSPVLGDDLDKLRPFVSAGQSDTATLDNVLELLLATGRSLPHAMMMLIPEAWADHIPMDQAKKDFYEYHSALMEPWDGPALVIGTDGKKVCGILDRNGLRPCRYLVTTDGLLVMASETGVLDIPPEKVRYKWRIQPGRMFMLDTEEGRLVDDDEIKASLSGMHPYGQWLSENKVSMDALPEPAHVAQADFETLAARHRAFGYTREELGMIIGPMGATGKEPVGSMGNDTPLAVFSDQAPLLFGYFKQHFAQVSNPPLDAIREELVTSMEAFLGAEGNLFEETPEQCRRLKLNEPVLTNRDLEKIKALDLPGLRATTLSALFRPADGPGALERAVNTLCEQASEAVKDGCSIIVLSDRGVDGEHAPIPSLLATAGVHHSLMREGARTRVGLVVESGEPREVAHFALLFGYGAGAVNGYLAFETLEDLAAHGNEPDIADYPTAEANFVKAVHKGVVKVMSKMGISTLASYHGAQIFEAVGLGRDLVDTYFTWTPSRIGGIGIGEIEKDSVRRHASAYHDKRVAGSQEMDAGGQYQWRNDGERHMWDPDSITKVQHAVSSGDAASFQDFTDYVDSQSSRLCTIRGLLGLKDADEPVPIDEVEPAKDIVKRFATGAISLGSISREAHETLAIAMNRIGARSNTGEGGEDPSRYEPDANGDSRNSKMKQVASGRFGVTSSYLASATDLQIKMAQGSKPGEGGQLPGHKVDEYIGWIRSSTPGVELISPPPHHDIYSIEDLAQLIHDLKNSNPEARIHVKLVSEAGVGTIAAGVSKGHADVVLISGDSGGTGASPESSIKHAGLPWELGVAETQQVLVMNDLRGRIVVQTDGQLKTGRDVAVACLLGAEEFGFATAPLITLGCIMLRKCHLNTCSVGIATQDPELRKKFAGKPEHVINYFFALAEQLREIMARMGFRTINEMVGRADRLDAREAVDHYQAKGIDLSSLLHMPNVPEGVATYCKERQDHGLDKALDRRLIEDSREALENGTPVRIDLPVRNANRTVGTMLSYEVSKRYGTAGLAEDTIQVHLTGSAGQSFASFLAAGISMYVEGDANDYFCKGLSGGKVVVTPPKSSTFLPEKNVIVGNVSLYGATGGSAFVNGVAGERFAVRNSGAEAVVEGVGDHGCEYMTRGRIVVLGPTGRNFAAGMSGGDAYVLDEEHKFKALCNLEMVDLEPVEAEDDVAGLRRLLEDHLKYTGSATAGRVLGDWDAMLPRFVKIMPREYKRALAERAAAAANGGKLAGEAGDG
jgi:glutamate synthase domain-containing protein 2/glutamate synthase domain-containing protein 1/glutamate synthase domain-containing protein 3